MLARITGEIIIDFVILLIALLLFIGSLLLRRKLAFCASLDNAPNWRRIRHSLEANCYMPWLPRSTIVSQVSLPFGSRERGEMDQILPHGVTELLVAWGEGARSAFEKLLPITERELHRIAHRYMS